uniref:Secreted protein n=1 Tax=Oryza meridionalis TaxID=40149 RepID=A0A0E0ER36_9ORYZ
MFLMSLALAAAHIAMAYRTSCRERRHQLVYRIDVEAIPIRVFERFWRTIEAYACLPFIGHDNGRKNPTSPHARKAMVEQWPADEGGRRHRRFLPPRLRRRARRRRPRSLRARCGARRRGAGRGRTHGRRAPHRWRRHPGRLQPNIPLWTVTY